MVRTGLFNWCELIGVVFWLEMIRGHIAVIEGGFGYGSSIESVNNNLVTHQKTLFNHMQSRQ